MYYLEYMKLFLIQDKLILNSIVYGFITPKYFKVLLF